jgi:hypothetical protein
MKKCGWLSRKKHNLMSGCQGVRIVYMRLGFFGFARKELERLPGKRGYLDEDIKWCRRSESLHFIQGRLTDTGVDPRGILSQYASNLAFRGIGG